MIKTTDHFRFGFLDFLIGLAGGSSAARTLTSLRMSASNAPNPFGFLAMINPLRQAHETAAIDLRQLAVGQSSANHRPHHVGETLSVICLAIVKTTHLLIDITLQMIRRDVDISAAQSAFEKRPEIFDAVGVDFAANVAEYLFESKHA